MTQTRKVIIITPFRNASYNLKRYFDQLSDLRTKMWNGNFADGQYPYVHLIALEGDSIDNTKERIKERCDFLDIPLTLIDVSHGQMAWKSVEDPRRLEAMSVIMNTGLDAANKISIDQNDCVVWLMSDIEYNAKSIVELIDSIDHLSIYAPVTLISGTDKFYDTWAYRIGNERFKQGYPYHSKIESDLKRAQEWGHAELSAEYPIDSAGTCLIMSAEVASKCRADKLEAVSFCADAREKGYHIYLTINCNVYHGDSKRPRMLLCAEILCQSGFARATHAVLSSLAEYYDIDIVGINYKGTPHNYPYRIYPAEMWGSGFAGEQVVSNLIFGANTTNNSSDPYDIVIIQGDTWNVAKTMMVIESMLETYPDVKRPERIISWLAVDGKNQDFEGLDKFDHHIVWTEFAAEEILDSTVDIESNKAYQGNISVVPLGVDTTQFYPINRSEIDRIDVLSKYNEDLPTITSETFIVGFVGLNQYRRRIDLIIASFAQWLKTGKFDAYLYLKTHSNIKSGCNIRSLARYHGIEDRIILNEYTGLSDASMCEIYNCFDLFISCAQGGAWELPVLEAVACGVPCIVPADGAVGSWVGEAALQVPCVSWLPHAPLNAQASVLGGIISTEDTARAIGKLYKFENMREELKVRGLALANKLTWKNSAEKFIEVVKK